MSARSNASPSREQLLQRCRAAAGVDEPVAIAPRSRRALGGTERREVHAGRPLRFARPGHAVAHAAFGHDVGRPARIVAKLAA